MTQATPYQSFPNSFKRDLLAGKKLIGCWSSLASLITTEVLGVAGFDWILLDGEHSPNDVSTFIPQLMALKDSPSAPFVRPTSNNEVEIKRLLDAGFYNILVPFVQTADDAQAWAERGPAWDEHGTRNLFAEVARSFAAFDAFTRRSSFCFCTRITRKRRIKPDKTFEGGGL